MRLTGKQMMMMIPLPPNKKAISHFHHFFLRTLSRLRLGGSRVNSFLSEGYNNTSIGQNSFAGTQTQMLLTNRLIIQIKPCRTGHQMAVLVYT